VPLPNGSRVSFFCTAHAAFDVGCSSLFPQYAQFAHPRSTDFPHCAQVGFSAVPQNGQNVKFAGAAARQFGQGEGSGSRITKYKIAPIPFGMKIASSVHRTWRILRRRASP